MDTSSVILPWVLLGQQCIIEPFCILGVQPQGESVAPTTIGDRAIIRSHCVIYAGNTIGTDFHAGHKSNIREYNTIGNHVSIGTLSVVEHHVVIGSNVRIHTQAFIPEYTILEEESWIGPNVVLTNAKYPRSPDVKRHLKGPLVRRGAKIGANSTILPGLVIGEGALIGAGSVVTKDVEPGTIVAGNPARRIGVVAY